MTDHSPAPQPSWRKPAGALAILAIIVVWSVGVASLSGIVGTWHVLIQGVFYVIAGIGWIAPMKPLLVWMEAGKTR